MLEFSVDQFFLNYQTLKDVENYLYKRFSIKTNKEMGEYFFLFFRSFGSIEWENRHQIWNLQERLRGKATSLSKKCHFQKVNGWQANINQQPIISQSLE